MKIQINIRIIVPALLLGNLTIAPKISNANEVSAIDELQNQEQNYLNSEPISKSAQDLQWSPTTSSSGELIDAHLISQTDWQDADNSENQSTDKPETIASSSETSETSDIGTELSNPATALNTNSQAQVSSKSQVELDSQIIKNCPREFTGWELIKTFETSSYSLALCRQGNANYLVGHEKNQHEVLIQANVISQFRSQNDNLIVAQDEQGFFYEVDNYQLKVSQNSKLIAQEKLSKLDSNLIIKSSNTESDSKQAADRQNSGGFTGPGSVDNQLQEDAQVTETVFPAIDRTFRPWFDWKEKVNQDIGLNFGVDYNFLYQNLTDSLGEGDATGGIFRAFGTWTLAGRDTDKPGSLVFKVENRHRFGSVAPQNLGFEAGYVGITGTQFSDYGWGLTNLYWQQKFNNGKLAFSIGTVDVTDYLDVYGLINPLTQFQNLSFSTNPTIAAPNQGLGASFGAMLSDNIYLVTGFADANGDATELGFETFFDEGEFFKHIEIGWTSSQERIYLDNIHLTAWHSDSIDDANLPSSWGLAFSSAWFINDRWMPFLRGGYSEGESALLQGNVSAGVGRYFSNSKNLLGFGLSWGQPTDDSLESQVTSEVFYRLQIAENWAITPDIQLLFNPALNPDEDMIAVFGIRSRLNF